MLFHPMASNILLLLWINSPNLSTTPLWQWGFRQCLPFSCTLLRGKHCRHPIGVIEVVDTFEHNSVKHCKAIRLVLVLLFWFYPDFILILSWFYLDFILILSRFYPDFLKTHFIQILSWFYPNFWKYLDKIRIKSG